MEKKGIKGESQPYNVKMRNLFGDLIEQAAMIIMKASGVVIQSEQTKTEYKLDAVTVNGTLDVEIEDKVWDIKSASPWSFVNKFGENGGFHAVAQDDLFGYLTQGYMYAESRQKPFGGWIVINKSTGEWVVTEAPIADDEYRENAISIIDNNIRAITLDKNLKDVSKPKTNTLERTRQAIKY